VSSCIFRMKQLANHAACRAMSFPGRDRRI
jgi:hypothetical protein